MGSSITAKQTPEKMRKLVREEGIAARNLISYSVPMQQPLTIDFDFNDESEDEPSGNKLLPPKSGGQIPSPHGKSRQSATRQVDFRMRCWAIMFENLGRAVDAIYETCQTDHSVAECREAIMMLDRYMNDFRQLIHFFDIEKQWEMSDKKLTAVAWEVRKTNITSPTKPLSVTSVTISAPKQEIGTQTEQKTKFSTESGTNTDEHIAPVAPEEKLSDSGIVKSPSSGAPSVASSEESSGNSYADKVKSLGKKGPADQQRARIPPEDFRSLLRTINSLHQPSAGIQMDWKRRQSAHERRSYPILPKSATEIRQTRASLAKMAYNRQYIAQRQLREKLENAANVRRKSLYPLLYEKKVASVPSLCSTEEKRGSTTFSSSTSSWCLVKGRRGKFRSFHSSESLCSSLQSIQEDEVYYEETTTVLGNVSIDPPDLRKPMPDVVPICPVPTDQENPPGGGSEDEGISSQSRDDDSSSAQKEVGDPDLTNLSDVTGDAISKKDCKTKKAVVSEQPDDEKCLVGKGEDGIEAEDGEEDDEEEEDLDDEASLQYLTEEEMSLAEEEDYLQREIEVEQRSVDEAIAAAEEADGQETEAIEGHQEIFVTEKREQSATSDRIVPQDITPLTWQDIVQKWNADSKFMLENGRKDFAQNIRIPGDVAYIHDKLSSPSRKRSENYSIQQHRQRQEKAGERRQMLFEKQSIRLRALAERVEEVRQQRKLVEEQKRALLESRMRRAKEKRDQNLKEIIRKAHDEREKVEEIVFINTLEANNKRHDVLSRYQYCDIRLQNLQVKQQEERQKRQEEKAAREAAVEERRKRMEKERRDKLADMTEKRRQRERIVEKQRCEIEVFRQKQAQDKRRERQVKLAEFKASQQANTEDLLQKIQQKDKEASRRHEETLEQIKQRASEMSIPRCMTDSWKSTGTVASGSSDTPPLQRSGPQKESVGLEKDPALSPCSSASLATTVETHQPNAEQDRSKAIKRKRQNIRKKLTFRANEYKNAEKRIVFKKNSQNKQRLEKVIRELKTCIDGSGLDSRIWLNSAVHALERCLSDIERILKQDVADDVEVFHDLDGSQTLCRLVALLEKPNPHPLLPGKCINRVITSLQDLLGRSKSLTLEFLYSNLVCHFIDSLSSQLKNLNSTESTGRSNQVSGSASSVSAISNKSWHPEPFSGALLHLCSELFAMYIKVMVASSDSCIIDSLPNGRAGYACRLTLLSSYAVSVNIVDYIAQYFGEKVNEVQNAGDFCPLFLPGFSLVIQLLRIWCVSAEKFFEYTEEPDDPTGIIGAVKRSRILTRAIDLAYNLLMSPECFNSCERHSPPAPLPEQTLNLLRSIFELVTIVGRLDLKGLQDILAEEGTSLEFRHIASHLISYCSNRNITELLHDVILTTGYFVVLNSKNQELVKSGSQPSIVQQLCLLPFQYFSRPSLVKVLFPTLISVAFQHQENIELFKEEFSLAPVATFIQDAMSKCEKKNEKQSKLSLLDKFDFKLRFPQDKWEEAFSFFKALI